MPREVNSIAPFLLSMSKITKLLNYFDFFLFKVNRILTFLLQIRISRSKLNILPIRHLVVKSTSN